MMKRRWKNEWECFWNVLEIIEQNLCCCRFALNIQTVHKPTRTEYYRHTKNHHNKHFLKCTDALCQQINALSPLNDSIMWIFFFLFVGLDMRMWYVHANFTYVYLLPRHLFFYLVEWDFQLRTKKNNLNWELTQKKWNPQRMSNTIINIITLFGLASTLRIILTYNEIAANAQQQKPQQFMG